MAPDAFADAVGPPHWRGKRARPSIGDLTSSTGAAASRTSRRISGSHMLHKRQRLGPRQMGKAPQQDKRQAPGCPDTCSRNELGGRIAVNWAAAAHVQEVACGTNLMHRRVGSYARVEARVQRPHSGCGMLSTSSATRSGWKLMSRDGRHHPPCNITMTVWCGQRVDQESSERRSSISRPKIKKARHLSAAGETNTMGIRTENGEQCNCRSASTPTMFQERSEIAAPLATSQASRW